MTTTQRETDEKEILKLQKDFMTRCIDYQITYGAGSITWGANANFIKDSTRVYIRERR